MAELVTLARPYARAVFGYARAAGALSEWLVSLKESAAVTRDAKVAALLHSPTITTDGKAQAFIDICGGDESVGKPLANFFHILAENNRLALLPQIAELYELYKANEEKTVDVEVLSAFDIPEDLESKLAITLKETLKRDVTLNTLVDASLIGGAIVRAGDTVIDGSVRGRLTKLAEAMNG
ncbi:ATP synthase F1 subcomplex delta subunit [Alteromonadaceae bacterium Bs31]|nr:ATP synthase F1 subcomplex delta subunit [Alteromonadaceae bacterium Bs31]